MEKLKYTPPLIEVIDVTVEKGFAISELPATAANYDDSEEW